MLRQETVSLLSCAACGSDALNSDVFAEGPDRQIETGVLWCRSCRSYFPVEEGILELVSGALADTQARDRFWSAHKAQLEPLGLEPPCRQGVAPGGRGRGEAAGAL